MTANPSTNGTVILPAYNEAERLPDVLRGISSCNLGLEVVVIDDGSHDATAATARTHRATVISHPLNLGYGAALQTGYKYALRTQTSFLVQMDADGQHDPTQIPLLVEPLLGDECDLVIGSRFAEDTGYKMGPLRSIGRKIMTGVAKLAGLQVTDPTSGFQAMNRSMLEHYASDDFPADYPDVDVLVRAHWGGFRVLERSVDMSESLRASTLHGGTRSIYYAYRMILSLLGAAFARRSA